MARIPMDIENRGLLGRVLGWYSRRRFGRVVQPAAVMAHHRGVVMASGRMERTVEKKWTALDPTLRCLATMAPSVAIGCEWCIDFGYWVSVNQGVDARKIEDVPRWRSSDAYTPVERQVLAYAEAMTATPPTVTDEMVAELRTALDDRQVVELTAFVALENYRSRVNAAMGLTADGFKAECTVPQRS
jgi:alkylhydroperoxidase family enzyme